MRKALIVGINHYSNMSCLKGCINDAKNVDRVLSTHADGKDFDTNFHNELIPSSGKDMSVTKNRLKDRAKELFRDQRDISLFYFAGHGYEEEGHGYLVTSDCERGDQGLPMAELLKMANESPAHSKIIILDCCHAGNMGQNFFTKDLTSIAEGVTILAASASNQYANEKNGKGIFTTLLCHALEGGAASILGEITPGNVYGYIDKAMGETGQRPIFITRVRRYSILRKVQSQINIAQLKKIIAFFNEGPNMEYRLDKTFEPTEKSAIPENVEKFKLLKLFNRVNLVIPTKLESPAHPMDMYYAAIQKKACILTPQGKSYWEMFNSGILKN